MSETAKPSSRIQVLVIIFILMASGQIGWSQFHNLNNDDFRFQMRGSSTRNYPIRALEPEIKYEPGKVGLVFDPQSSKNNRVNVYLVNDSEQSVSVARKSLELPIVLEADLGNGKWERAETRNDRSKFKLTNRKDTIAAGYYRKRQCRYWAEGMDANLRYAVYENGKPIVISKPFKGKLPSGTIYTTRRDAMAASLVPEVLRIRYKSDETSFKEISQEWLDKLTLLQQLGPCYLDFDEAQKWTAEVHANPVSKREHRDLAIQLQTIMLQDRPHQFQLSQLLDFCRQTVSQQNESRPSLRALCWTLLRDMAQTDESISNPELAQIAWDALSRKGSQQENLAITQFLCSDAVALGNSPINKKADQEQLLESENPYIRIVTANWMLRQRRTGNMSIQSKVLNHYTVKRPADVPIFELISILHFDRIYSPYTDPPWGLWTRALDADREYTVSNLALMFEFDERKFAKKFKMSEDILPSSIKSRLYTYYQETPESATGVYAKKLLDQGKRKSKRVNGFDIRF